MPKFAIICSAENQIHPARPSVDGSSGYEKMAIGLMYSIREFMPDVDVYCGNFTSNTLSDLARKHFSKLNIKLVEDLVFPKIKTTEFDGKADNVKNDYYTFNGFLRNFTKDYFAKKLLAEYDYLIYTDIDVLFLKPLDFNFDPVGNNILIEPIPEWSKKTISPHIQTSIVGDNLYLNWVDVINNNNKFVFDMDYMDMTLHADHASDVVITNRIDQSSLTKINQDIGGYHCYKPPSVNSQLYHYDSLGEFGTLYLLKDTHPALYRKYIMLFEHVLNIKVINREGYWEQNRDTHS